MSQPGGSSTVRLPWCPTCHRSRFGTSCVECGGQLVLEDFVRCEDALLDAAKAAKEVAMLTALVLMQTGGNPTCALPMMDDLDGLAPSLSEELDAVKIGQQAIREALDLKAELRG